MDNDQKDFEAIRNMVRLGDLSFNNPLWHGAIKYAQIALKLTATYQEKESYWKQAKEMIYFEARQILKENPNDPMAMSDYSAIIDNKISKELNDRIVSLRQKMIVRSYIEESFI